MIGRRRRPLLRGAMVAGAGYAVGKRVQSGREAEAYQDQQIAELQQQQYAQQAPAPAAGGGLSSGAIEELKQLAELNKQGILTDEEFAAQKQKLLAGG